MAPRQPHRKRLDLLMGMGSAPEEMARGHEVDHALQVGTTDGVQDAEEEREDEEDGDESRRSVKDADLLDDLHDSCATALRWCWMVLAVF